MPHLPDSQHPDHDLELIAGYAAGDATGPELERATAQVAGCDECAALHHDLRSIAAAMPTLPAAVRSRDFTLTPEQAARLRPSGIRGLLATLSGPRFSFATPVGTGLAALGIVGVIVASGGLPASGGSAAPQPETAVTQNDQPAASAAGAAGAALASGAPAAEAPAEAAASAGASAAPLGDGESPGVDTMGGGEQQSSPEPAAAASEAPASAGTELYMTADPSSDPSRQSAAVPDPARSPDSIQAITAPTAPASSSSAWVGGATFLAALGVALVLVRWGARRLT